MFAKLEATEHQTQCFAARNASRLRWSSCSGVATSGLSARKASISRRVAANTCTLSRSISSLRALRVKIRDEGFSATSGIRPDGTKEILGIWIEQTEGAKFWPRVMNELKTRGIGDILIAVVDGLKGFPFLTAPRPSGRISSYIKTDTTAVPTDCYISTDSLLRNYRSVDT